MSASAVMPRRRSPSPMRAEALLDAFAPAPVEHASSFGSGGRASLRTTRSRPRALSTVPPRLPGRRRPPGGRARRTWWCREAPFVQSPRPGTRTRGSWVKTFPTAKIRNVALVGHGGAGKTSLAEALLLRRRGDPPPGPGRGRLDGLRLRPRGAAPQHLGLARARPVRARRPQGERARHARVRRLRRRRRRRDPGRRPRAVRRVRGRRRRGADRDRVEARRAARHCRARSS